MPTSEIGFDVIYPQKTRFLSYNATTMYEPNQAEKPFLERHQKPLAWFFIVIILLNPFLAPLLAGLLKSNTETEDHTEPDPFDFFETMDRTFFSFPMAKAEPLPANQLYKIFPEFLAGADNPNESEKKAMEIGFNAISSSLDDFLQTTTEQSKVIVLLEDNHHETFIIRSLLLAYLKQREISVPVALKITIICEMSFNATLLAQYETSARKEFDFARKSTQYGREDVQRYFQQNCYRHHDTIERDRLAPLYICFLFAVEAYGFTLLTANFKDHETLTKFNIYDVQRKQTINGSSLSLQEMTTVEKPLIDHLKKSLSHSSANDITVVITGQLHGKRMYEVLEKLAHPFRFLQTNSTVTRYYPATYEKLATSCIKPKKECPPEDCSSATHCVVPTPYEPKTCDRKYYRMFSILHDRAQFSKSKHVTILPETLPTVYPANFFHFFGPKKSIDERKEKLQKEKERSKTHAKQQNL